MECPLGKTTIKTTLSQNSQNLEQTSKFEEIDLNEPFEAIEENDEMHETFSKRNFILVSSIVLNIILLISLISVIVMFQTDKSKQDDSSLGTDTKIENLTIANALSGAKINCSNEELECQQGYDSSGKECLIYKKR